MLDHNKDGDNVDKMEEESKCESQCSENVGGESYEVWSGWFRREEPSRS